MNRQAAVLPVHPQTKVTAEDWLDLARRVLIEDGVEQVRVLSLAQALGVSRSSFYWYFGSRDDLLGRLLAFWENKNTKGLVDRASMVAVSLADAMVYLMECWIDDGLFDPRLDFAIRDWARRSPRVMTLLRRSDEERLAAIEAMYVRHGVAAADARTQANVVYFMQVGYYAVGVEPLRTRLANVQAYVRAFTRSEATPEQIDRIGRVAARVHRTDEERRRGAVLDTYV